MNAAQYIYGVAQGSSEWLDMRAGILTASDFATACGRDRSGKGLGAGAKTLAYKIAAEIITESPTESFSTAATERGHADEVVAREYYEATRGVEVVECGFIIGGDYGYSPDGLVGDDGLIEIKSKAPHLFLQVVDAGEVPKEHMHQIQGGMMVSGRAWCDFVCFCDGFTPFVKRVNRDDSFIEGMSAALGLFSAEVARIVRAYEGRAA